MVSAASPARWVATCGSSRVPVRISPVPIPEVRAAVAAQHARELLLDGEVVAYDGDQTSFTRLQQRLGVAAPSPEQVAKYPVVYCVFDLLELDGEDLTDRPLVDRRAG